MTDISKKAIEYAEEQISGMEFANDYERTCEIDNYRCAFLAGAAYALSNQWRDAENVKPPFDEDVLTDCPYEHGHAVGYYDGEDWYMTENGRLIRPTHWMPIPPIPEYEPKGE